MVDRSVGILLPPRLPRRATADAVSKIWAWLQVRNLVFWIRIWANMYSTSETDPRNIICLIKQAHMALQVRFEDSSYQSFDYHEVMKVSLNFIEEVQIALRRIYEEEAYEDTYVDDVDERDVNGT